MSSTGITKDGFIRNSLCFGDGTHNHFYRHRLVALAFISNLEELPLVHHKDGNLLNNNVDNLVWCDGV